MLNRTTHELIFIRICVIFLSCAPLFYIVFLPLPLAALALSLELAYYLFILRRFKTRLAGQADHPPDTRQEREALFQRCLQNIPDPERYLSLWAHGADPAEIKRENLREFFLWAFFDRQHDCPDDADIQDELEGYITGTEALLGRTLAPGRGSARSLRLTFDDIPTRYRCLLWYLIVALVDSATHLRMLRRGFHFYAAPAPHASVFHVFPPRPLVSMRWPDRRFSAGELNYWYRPAATTATTGGSTTRPVVFLHGIGIGLYPYVPFLNDLPPTSPVLAVEILPISMRLTKTNILARPDFVRQLKAILHQHGIDCFVLISHSYGSILTTHVLRDSELGPQVEGVVLVDPVSLLLHLPDVAYNFTRRMPTFANEWQLWYMASMDPGIALVLGRHFFWRENIIWKDELVSRGPLGQRRAAVCLASRDLIVDTLTVGRYLVLKDGLTEHARRQDPAGDEELAVALGSGTANTTTASGVELLWFDLDHAQVFDKRQDYGRILDVVRRFCA